MLLPPTMLHAGSLLLLFHCGVGMQMFQQQVAPTQSEVDHCNDLANQFTDIVLSHRNVSRLEDLNRRSVGVSLTLYSVSVCDTVITLSACVTLSTCDTLSVRVRDVKTCLFVLCFFLLFFKLFFFVFW